MAESVESLVEKIKNEKDVFVKAKLILYLVKDKAIRICDLSKKIGIKPSYICHFLRLNNLPDIIVDGYYSKQISISHLFVISRLKNKQDMVDIYEKVLTNNLTVERTEQTVRHALYQIKNRGDYIDQEEIESFLQSVNKKDQIKAKIIQSRIRAKLILEFWGDLEQTSNKLRELIKKIKS